MKPRIPFASEPCDEASPECVVATAFTYLDALISHDAGSVRLTDDVIRTHNGQTDGIRGADQLRAVILLEPVAAHYNFRWIVEGDQGVAFYDMDVDISRSGKTVDDGFGPFSEQMHTTIAERFRVENGLIREIEVYYSGGGLERPPARPYRRDSAPGQETRADRSSVIAAGEAFLAALASGDSDSVPLAPDVWRIENGVNIADSEAEVRKQLASRDGTTAMLTDARWFVDGGQAAAFYALTASDTGSAQHMAQRLRVESGLIKEIETVIGAAAS